MGAEISSFCLASCTRGDVVGKDGVVDIADIIYICTVVDGEGCRYPSKNRRWRQTDRPGWLRGCRGSKGRWIRYFAALQIVSNWMLDAVGDLSTFLDRSKSPIFPCSTATTSCCSKPETPAWSRDGSSFNL